ncbi:MAG TPA: OB-fold nucleic acid binding domain-containing protein [Candidatus Nanoarchaeia archaeon]|nr:OB-fold nucleic acid binding domain-containing protein [Candidatus Nanoarchaeia archaeon]
MEITDIKSNTGNIDVQGEIVEIGEIREFNKFGRSGKVANAKLKTSSGEITLTLWNDQVDQVKVGDKVHLINGWASEFKEEIQISTGKFGKLEVVN